MQEFINIALSINTKIDQLERKVDCLTKTHVQVLKEEWIDKQQVKQILKIGDRKLQTMRDNGTLPFSQIDGKLYYRTFDVEKLLAKNYNAK